jgi:hypothetical protein
MIPGEKAMDILKLIKKELQRTCIWLKLELLAEIKPSKRKIHIWLLLKSELHRIQDPRLD